MKNLKKITLAFLGTTLLSFSIYSCSNDDETIAPANEKQSMSKETITDAEKLGSDADYIDFVKIILDESEKKYDIKLINNIIEDNTVSEREYL